MMGMGRFFGRHRGWLAAVAALAAPAFLLPACGSNNDQGLSFRIVNFLGQDDEGLFSEDSPLTDGTVIRLACSGGEIFGITVENVLAQGIFVERADVTYDIPGSQVGLNRSSSTMAFRLGPSNLQEPSNSPRGFGSFFVLTPSQIEFLSQNRNRLPDFPFRIIAEVTALGTKDDGGTLRTQTAFFTVDVLDDTGGCPSEEESAEESAEGEGGEA